MTTVPTLATQNSLIRRMLQQQASMYSAQYSATTYKKSQTYSGISKDVYKLLNLKNEKSIMETQISNNTSLSSRINAVSKSLESISSTLTDFRSSLRDFSGNDLSKYIAGNMDSDKENSLSSIQQLAFDTLSELSYYLNTKLDGSYLFGGGSYNNNPIDFDFESLEKFQEYYDGEFVTYPESRSANLSNYTSTSDKTGDLSLQKLYTVVDTTTTGAVTIGADNTMTAANPNAFSDLKVGMEVTIESDEIGSITRTIESISEDGTVIVFTEDLPAGSGTTNLKLTQDQNMGTITAANADGFIVDNIIGSNATTGDFTFNTAKNQMTIPIKNGFAKLTAGSAIVISGTTNNDGIYYVEDVSEDGRTVTFSDATKVKADEAYVPAANVTVGVSYGVGTNISLAGTNQSYNGNYSIVGVSQNGQQLIVKTDKFLNTAQTFTPTTNSPVSSSSYYGGSALKVQYRIDSSTNIDMTITAEDGAFEKAIRALAMIAQGNMVDADGVDKTRVYDRVMEALDLIDSALDATDLQGESTSNITSLQNRISNNYSLTQNAIDNQETIVELLTTNISDIEDVDPLEAALALTTAQDALNASYSIIAKVKEMSLLNYL